MRRRAMTMAAVTAAALLGCVEQAMDRRAGSAVDSDRTVSGTGALLSLWPSNTVPASFADADGTAIELGVKFKASTPGSVVGVRFYKGAENTGTHLGHLWTATGSPLGSTTFTAETAAGWQTAYFPTPIPIEAGAVYVASYFAPNGHYAGEGGYFGATGRTSGPLYALSDGEAGGNGVYLRSAEGGFPTASYDANNYYVDPLFVPEGSGHGLTAQYFGKPNLTDLKRTRIDPQVSFDWFAGSPAPEVPADRFSARWTGQVLAPVTGDYTFATISDDGVRLWVNGQKLIDNWTDHAAAADSGRIALIAGQRYDLKLEYYENGGLATLRLSWSVPGQSAATLPSAQLFPSACQASCAGKVCGDDGCGGSCGSCAAGETCDPSGQCAAPNCCAPACAGKQCGDDGCGGSCGSCAAGQTCNPSGQCTASTCAPSCAGKQCGGDGCGGSCGSCPAGQSCDLGGRCAAAGPMPSGSPWFSLMDEIYGDAGSEAQQRMSEGLLDGVDFHAPLTASEQQFLSTNKVPVAYFAIPPEANVQSCYPWGTDANAAGILTGLTQQLGPKVWRLGMPEFDQGGGCWAAGRPGVAGMTDLQAYDTWMRFYLDTKRLRPYLSQSAEQRGYKWMTLCSFAFSTGYAYDMGSDLVLLERNEDEMSGITPGLAMVRGAARQHGGKDWGIDLSTWRYWNNGPTAYSGGRLVTGWSTSTFKRNMFIAYMGGANVIHLEAADFRTGAVSGSSLNPLGQTVQQFHDFAVKRHSARGTPFVPMALMQDHYSGLEPKFGEWMQLGSKWYFQNPYSQGDAFLSNLMSVVYPSYNAWGTLGNGAPKVLNPDGSINVGATYSAYQQALATGADPRPWEPMGNSRWGESFDIITNQASLAALQRYQAVVLATGEPMSDGLLATLTQYVQAGGTVVLNARQLTASAEKLAGLHLTAGRASATGETWLPDGSALSEKSFNYTLVTPTTATLVAQSSGNPIVTKNQVGSGTAYVTTPDFLADAAGSQLLNVGRKLIDSLQSQCAPVQVKGPPLEYLISTDGGRVIVTLVNTDTSGAAWNGTLSFSRPASSYSVKEWTGDAAVASSLQDGKVVVSATVPAYDVRVYVLDVP